MRQQFFNLADFLCRHSFQYITQIGYGSSQHSSVDLIKVIILAARGLAEQWSYETLRQFSIAKSKIELEIYSP